MAECPAAALADTTLAAGAKVVLTVLWAHGGADKRFVWPARDLVCTKAGMKPRTLRKHLADLKERGWIVPAELDGHKAAA